jgi:hypothetical protein
LPLLVGATGLIGLAAYPFFAASLEPGSTSVAENLQQVRIVDCDSKFTAGLDEEFISDTGCPSVIRTVVNVENVDVVDEKTVLLQARVYPDGDLGMLLENGGVLHEATILSYDGVGETNTLLPAGSWTTGKAIPFNLKNTGAIMNYPFDSYSGDWSVIAQSAETGVTVPLWLAAEDGDVAGFDVALSRNPLPEDLGDVITVNPSGAGSLHFEIRRSSSDIFQAVFLAAILLISLFAATLTTYFVVRAKRPPSLGLIGWLATFLFSVISLRTTFPGNPPIGVNLDKFVTFPVVALILFFIVVNAYLWLRRDDWDMGNELPAAG